ncbi:MAG: UvrD-helicase domain-containing protein [Erysipelotrichaceae bacterium]|nr:UvrD-helicase domain-containing protein [Erysipelotrichaceae bacterium]
MPIWNEAQRKAIDTRNKNVLVSASAGAGKTTVLIARLCELVVHSRIGIEHILAMTFTEAAANEMKKRLAAALYELYEQSEEESERTYLSAQLSAIQTAHISTIHSFCLSIIQEFYYVIHLSGAMVNHIMSDADAQMVKAEALEQVLREEYRKGDDAFYRLCVMFSARGEDDEKLKQAIMSLAVSANAQSDPDAWLTQCEQRYRRFSAITQLDEEVQELFFDGLKQRCEQYMNACETLYNRLKQVYSNEEKRLESAGRKCDGFAAIRSALKQRDYNAVRDALIAVAHVVMPTASDKEDQIYKRLRERSLTLEDELLGRCFEERQLLEDIADDEIIIKKLVELARAFQKEFSRRKMELECIDFDDMEHFALRILRANDGAVAAHYRELFDEIMVDEFQDSNDVQNELVRLIERGNNVFRVGDIKQSIYGFRHAKPQLMRSLIEHAGDQDEVLYLSNNYRSKKTIVDFNNQLFAELMNLDGFDGSYGENDNVSCGVSAQMQENHAIVFHALEREAILADGDFICGGNELKASYIAAQIIQRKENEQRKWKDFVVLVRSNSRKKELKQVFERLGIPNFINAGSGFYQSSAVSAILAVCDALRNPYDDLHFVAAMSSPLFQLSMQELADIKLRKGEECFYRAMMAQQHPLVLAFEQLRTLLYQSSPTKLFRALYGMRQFYEEHTNLQERTNLDLLYEQATRFELEQGKGVLSFLRTLHALAEQESAEAMPIGSEDDVVRVMSIHQSKGLQFPIVFLWSSSEQKAISFQELYVYDNDLGIGWKHMDIEQRFVRASIYRMALEHKLDKEELEEEMRILYVATTRAQNQLHIVDFVSPDEDDEPLRSALVYDRCGYSGWMLHSALARSGSALLRIERVNRMWSQEVISSETSQEIHKQYYRYQEAVYELKSPSTLAHAPSLANLNSTNQEAMRYGSKLHALIENMPKGVWQEADYARLNPQPSSSMLAALRRLNAHPVFQKANAYPQVFHELPFTLSDGQTILHGFIDYAAIGDDIILIDFKTDRIQDMEELKKRYREQVLAYERAMCLLYPTLEVHSYVYSLYLHEMILVSHIQREARG